MTTSIRSAACAPIASSRTTRGTRRCSPERRSDSCPRSTRSHTTADVLTTPDIYPRLAYRDELAAVEYLTRVFQFAENREARMEYDGKYLCWMRVGSGVVMLGHANPDVHFIHSPLDAGLTTVMINVYVHDIDAHYAHAVAEGADITMELDDAFFGERRYEATDPEGHRWHFGERFDDIRARGGRPPETGRVTAIPKRAPPKRRRPRCTRTPSCTAVAVLHLALDQRDPAACFATRRPVSDRA